MEFYKMHGLGNDYIYFYLINEPTEYEFIHDKILQNIEFLCNRNKGIGADGVVLILPSNIASVKMRIFNKDGSEAEICGNALRCVGKLYGNLEQCKNLSIETKAGVVLVENINTVDVKVQLPTLPKIDTTLHILTVYNKKMPYYYVDVGNPHVVINFQDYANINSVKQELQDFNLEKYGTAIENNTELFPNKTNVEFYSSLDSKTINMRVWERGSGETLACGTGAVAVATVNNYVNSIHNTTIKMLGGSLNVSYANNHCYMIGEAVMVYKGNIFL